MARWIDDMLRLTIVGTALALLALLFS